ncbi:Uncharacterised protein [Salmonella bongori]|nr:Uncharacterised protein [Salmonella bongori]
MATATGIKFKKFGEEFSNRLPEDELKLCFGLHRVLGKSH